MTKRRLTKEQTEKLKAIEAESAERAKRDAAVCAQFPVATAYGIVEVARERAWGMLFDAEHNAATLDATAHTLAMVAVALHAAGVSDPAE